MLHPMPVLWRPDFRLLIDAVQLADQIPEGITPIRTNPIDIYPDAFRITDHPQPFWQWKRTIRPAQPRLLKPLLTLPSPRGSSPYTRGRIALHHFPPRESSPVNSDRR